MHHRTTPLYSWLSGRDLHEVDVREVCNDLEYPIRPDIPSLGYGGGHVAYCLILSVAVHWSPASACPTGQIEDMKLAVCASEDDDVAWKVTAAPAENEPESLAVSIDKIMMADLQQPYTGREAYLTDDQGSWFFA